MNRFLILGAIWVLSMTACKKDNNGPGENGTPQFNNVQKNNTIITTQEGHVVIVDPANGTAERIFNFGDYNDATGFDYHEGTIYIGDESNTINAIDMNSKSLKWRVPFVKDKPSTASWVQVIMKEGICYASGDEGVIVAIDPVNKKALWANAADPAFDINESNYFPGNLSVIGDKVIFGSNHTVFYDDADRNYVYLYERSTGKRLLKLTLPAETYVSGKVNIAGNTLLIPMRVLVAVDLTTGQEKWRLAMPGLSRGAGTPIIVGEKVLVQGASATGHGGKLFCLSLANGSKLWEIEGGMDMVGRYTPTVIDGKYVLGFYERGTSLSTNGRPFLALIDNGKKIWENDDLSIDANGTYANGKIYVFGMKLDGNPGSGGGLMCIDAATGKLDWINEDINGLVNSQPLVIAENGLFRGPQFF